MEPVSRPLNRRGGAADNPPARFFEPSQCTYIDATVTGESTACDKTSAEPLRMRPNAV